MTNNRSARGRRPSRPNAQPLRVEIRKHTARIEPPFPDLLRSILECPVQDFEPGGPRGFRQVETTMIFHTIDKCGGLLVPAGLVPRIVTCLKQHGYQVMVRDRTFWSQFSRANASVLQDPTLDAYDRKVLAAIVGTPRGQLLVQRQDYTARLISLINCLFSQANILVGTANQTRARQLYRRLARTSDRPVQLSPQINWRHGRVFVRPAATFALCTNPEDWDIVICADPETALAKDPFETVSLMDDQLRYCVVPEEREHGR